jgi:putative ABC transport system permease protein
LDLGDLGQAQWQVIGVYKVIYGSGFVVEPVYAPLQAVHAATSKTGSGNRLLVRGQVETIEQEETLAGELKTLFEDQGMRLDFYTTTARLEQRQYADNQFSAVTSTLLSLAMLVAAVGGIGLAGSLGISVVERRREVGVMRSMGAPGAALMGVFMMEGLLQGLLSWLVTVPLAFLLAQPLARALGQTMLEVNLDYAFNYPAVAVWLLAVALISALASILPAYSATRISVRQSLAYT